MWTRKTSRPLTKKNMEIELYDVSSQYSASVKTLTYDIYVRGLDRVVGQCEYRYETKPIDLEYYGHIGYNIYIPYRGANFSYKACRQMFSILYNDYGIKDILITCNPDNYPSKKTIIKLGGNYIKTVDVDPDHELYKFGEVQKEIYTIELKQFET